MTPFNNKKTTTKPGVGGKVEIYGMNPVVVVKRLNNNLFKNV